MISMAVPIASRFVDAATRVAHAVPGADLAAAIADLGDESLLALLADGSDARRSLEVVMATASAEAARRSARDLGYSGLAQRNGHRSVTSLVQTITGQSRGDVARTLKAGEELTAHATDPTDTRGQAEAAGQRSPLWLSTLRGALSDATISQAQFHAIRVGLGDPPIERYPALEPEFLPSAWAEAVTLLLAESTSLPVEELRAAAQIARDRLDPAGVALRFDERFEARSFRTWIDESGQHHGRFVFDDEAAAWVHAILQAALRPRRGPRFVGPDAKQKTAEADADLRSHEQLQYDTLMAVLRTGANADPGQAFGDRQPGVRIIVEAPAVGGDGERGGMRVTGIGHLEDSGQSLPGGVVEKYLCDAGALPIIVGAHGRPLDLGREQRLFTRRQRIAIAARDGGCLWPSCTAPPSQCEYHHLDHWWEHHGATDVDDGVPLCRNCHLRLHNQGWRITRERDGAVGHDTYWLHPPPRPGAGVREEAIRLVSKSPRRFSAA